MNFLAHSLVARDQADLVVGAFLGDEIRGERGVWSHLWFARGIALHRYVDSYADEHPAFIRSRRRFSPPYRRFAGILVDLAYDHLLAKQFGRYCEQSLSQFSQQTAMHLGQGQAAFSPRMHGLHRAITENDLLISYGSDAGMRNVLRAISKRFSRPSPLASAWSPVMDCMDGLAEDFDQFMPELWQATALWLKARPAQG